MAEHTIVDAGFLVALLSRRDRHDAWAVARAQRFPPPWSTCEAVLSEAFHLVEARGAPGLSTLLRRRAVVSGFDLDADLERPLRPSTSTEMCR